MNYKSIADLNNDIIHGIQKLPRDVDLVIGLPRSGMLAASILAIHAHLPLIDIDSFIHGRPAWFGETKMANRVSPLSDARDAKCPLLFDDSVYSGRSIKNALMRINEVHNNRNILTGTVYVNPDKKNQIDFYIEIMGFPRVFEWNLMHHTIITEACVDIDGVLCRDPENYENDDGPLYLNFIRDVPALRRPSLEIGWLVTCRLERYRAETEEWLRKNEIKYNKLIMLDLKTVEERRKLGVHASFKAEVYKKTNAKLFVESSLDQAIDIARISGKGVICYENGQMEWPDGLLAKQIALGRWKRYVPFPVKQIYRKLKEIVVAK
jgi:uncharacterized HAD superfamily protein